MTFNTDNSKEKVMSKIEMEAAVLECFCACVSVQVLTYKQWASTLIEEVLPDSWIKGSDECGEEEPLWRRIVLDRARDYAQLACAC